MDETNNELSPAEFRDTEAAHSNESRWISARLAAHRKKGEANGPALSLRMKARQLRAQADALEAAAKQAIAPKGLASLFRTPPPPPTGTSRPIAGLASSLQLALAHLPSLSRAEVGGPHFDLEDMIHHACHANMTEARAKGIEVLVDYAPSLPTVFYGEAHALTQWVEGALREALAAGGGGYVMLRVSGHMIGSHTYRLVLSLEDDGHGLSPNNLVRLFAPHQNPPQLGSQNTPPNRMILERDGLMIWCESSARKGTIFGLRLDLSSSDVGRRGLRGPAQLTTEPRALVIAPRFQSRAILERELVTAGAKVALSRNIVEALTLIRGGARFDVVIVDDSQNPDDAATRLRRAGHERAIFQLSSLGRSAHPVGFDAVLSKPLRRSDLHASLEQLARQETDERAQNIAAIAQTPPQDGTAARAGRGLDPLFEHAQRAPDKSPRNMRVLMIEPNETNQLMLRKMTAGQPIDLRMLRDERGVLREVETRAPDLILLDVSLRRCEQIIAHIRASEIRLRRAHTPLIALSSSPSDQAFAPVETSVAPQFVTPRYCSTSLEKPLRKSALIKAINDHRPAHCHALLPEVQAPSP